MSVHVTAKDNSEIGISHLFVSGPLKKVKLHSKTGSGSNSDLTHYPASGQFLLELHSKSGQFVPVLNSGDYRFSICDTYLFYPIVDQRTVNGDVTLSYALKPVKDRELVIQGHVRGPRSEPLPLEVELHDQKTQCLIQKVRIESNGNFYQKFIVASDLNYSMFVNDIAGNREVRGAKGELFVELAIERKKSDEKVLKTTMCEFNRDQMNLTCETCGDCNSLSAPWSCLSKAHSRTDRTVLSDGPHECSK